MSGHRLRVRDGGSIQTGTTTTKRPFGPPQDYPQADRSISRRLRHHPRWPSRSIKPSGMSHTGHHVDQTRLNAWWQWLDPRRTTSPTLNIPLGDVKVSPDPTSSSLWSPTPVDHLDVRLLRSRPPPRMMRSIIRRHPLLRHPQKPQRVPIRPRPTGQAHRDSFFPTYSAISHQRIEQSARNMKPTQPYSYSKPSSFTISAVPRSSMIEHGKSTRRVITGRSAKTSLPHTGRSRSPPEERVG